MNHSVKASVNTYYQLLCHVLHLPKSFFDTNPSGENLLWSYINNKKGEYRISSRTSLFIPHCFSLQFPGRVLNRFSRDTDIMDATLSQSLAQFTGCIAVLICNIIVIAIATKWFAIAIPPIAVVYFFIQRCEQLSLLQLQLSLIHHIDVYLFSFSPKICLSLLYWYFIKFKSYTDLIIFLPVQVLHSHG